ncbi:hypothetical protein DQM25_01760 [Enterococcus faecium]|uniref:Uncharacterized protein n=1 Tax=Enterococcus faecium TaxID=1352 RepID=A0A7V7GP76_ENTFC|nr:hypothetical protein D9Z05_09330 [Enterococcus faecium]EGP5689183.1 hypothetical protein [Enterococcus faecium]KAA0691531.1 hypothetical protein DTX73_04245 [Enterococcus faecium]PHL16286.1 hypothetical protein CQR38_05085 [Enterococcus faecium]RDG10673.1 hypothetical protein DQM25_01760 [Enterococcus faecium]
MYERLWNQRLDLSISLTKRKNSFSYFTDCCATTESQLIEHRLLGKRDGDTAFVTVLYEIVFP